MVKLQCCFYFCTFGHVKNNEYGLFSSWKNTCFLFFFKSLPNISRYYIQDYMQVGGKFIWNTIQGCFLNIYSGLYNLKIIRHVIVAFLAFSPPHEAFTLRDLHGHVAPDHLLQHQPEEYWQDIIHLSFHVLFVFMFLVYFLLFDFTTLMVVCISTTTVRILNLRSPQGSLSWAFLTTLTSLSHLPVPKPW